jgi:hypothetical protein
VPTYWTPRLDVKVSTGRCEASGSGFEDGGNFRRSHEPVATTTQRLTVNDGETSTTLTYRGFVLFLDRIAESRIEVPNGDRTGVVTKVGENFTVDFEVDFLSQDGGQFSLGVEVVLRAKVLLSFVAPDGLQLAGLGGDFFRLDDQVDFRQILVGIPCCTRRGDEVVGAGVATGPLKRDFAGVQVNGRAGSLSLDVTVPMSVKVKVPAERPRRSGWPCYRRRRCR